MKKTLLLTSVALLVAMTSCMKDVVVGENKGNVIDFRTAVETRGLEANKWTLPYFLVTALEPGADTPYFADVQFVRDNNSNYVSNNDYYWPGNDRKLSFYAYAPSEEEMGGATVVLTHEEKSIEGFTVNPNISEQKDFIYAYNEGDGSGLSEEDGSVELAFMHRLSRINFSANTSSDYIYNCKGVRIGGVYNKGSMDDITDVVWTIDNDAQKSVFEKVLDEPVTISYRYGGDYLMGKQLDIYGDETDEYAFMLPQTFTAWDPENDPTNENGGAYISVYLQITTEAGARIYPNEADGEYAWVSVPISGEWQTQYSYVYYLNFTNGAGYGDPTTGDAGKEVLGDASIKVLASMNGMPDAIEDMVVNPNMIGEWTAMNFQNDTYRIQIEANFIENEYGSVIGTEPIFDDEGNPVFVLDENGEPRMLYEEHETHTENLFYQIGGFAHITILDGKQAITMVPGSNIEQVTDYVVTDDNYVLIECYRKSGEKGSKNLEDYDVHPQMTSIVPARTDAPGKADIYTKSFDFDNYGWYDADGDGDTELVAYMWLNEQYIDYRIDYIGPDVEQQ